MEKPKNNESLYGLRYAEFIVSLVKAVQKLSATNNLKNEKINALQTENELLKPHLDKIETAIAADSKQGNVQVANNANELAQGTYTLAVNVARVDTNLMVLVKYNSYYNFNFILKGLSQKHDNHFLWVLNCLTTSYRNMFNFMN